MAPLQQIAALCWRKRKGAVEVLLVTSRETRRWVIPKGWPMEGLADFNAARREAFEEAGVEGRMRREPIGQYFYEKRGKKEVLPVTVTVYALEVVRKLKSWPEAKERERSWFSPHDAMLRVAEPGLKDILSTFTG
ncbi:NUDIX hydrolase [Aestuariivirga sp.]|uniref:NUDIX hydrolase n=1 Tax=Aestuariivirga sp. TaxID=2650926 RepID=UPI0039E35D86